MLCYRKEYKMEKDIVKKPIAKKNRKKGIKRIIKYVVMAIGTIVLLLLIMNVVQYYKLKKDNKKSIEQGVQIILDDHIEPIDLVGLLDSYGVPYSEEVEYSFMDMLAEELASQDKIDSRLDLYNLYINKTWHLDGIFRNRVSINEMVDMKNFSLDFVRYKYKEKIKSSLSYEYEESGENSVYDYVSDLDNPVVLYSCSANDLFYYFGTSLESLNFQRGIELIKNLDGGLDFLERNVQNNINTIIECNPKSQIFVMSIYVPSDNFIVNRAGEFVIDKINRRLEKVCLKYDNVYYVDVSSVCFSVLEGDFHPNQDGQKIIANKLAEAISENLKPAREYVYDKVECTPVELDIIGAEEFVSKFNECKLPMTDYIEYSVAIEWVLDELDRKNISYECLIDIEDEILSELGKKIDVELFKKGFNIVVIEHKILDGIIEADLSLHPETKHNDKLSLIEYYD